ncbi:MAG TPA: hypothetical protein VHD87_05085 [Acidimicrobiales bacterium]|nr:hypothetical protein [Acidimicrobiales bacterium]
MGMRGTGMRCVALAIALALTTSVGAPGRAGAEEDDRRLGLDIETRADMVQSASQMAMRFDLGAGSAYAEASTAAHALPQTQGRWTSVDRGSIVFDDPRYLDDGDASTGLQRSEGRVTDFANDAAHDRVFAAFGHGGVWASDNRGNTWRPVGDALPTQTIGAVAYTPAGGGTLLALTGDNAAGSISEDAGQGIFWSSDLGGTWHKASGAPDGVLGFRLAVRDDAPATVYAATGAGLFRSVDAGRSWTDTVLPTGPCAGRTSAPNCFFANMVTDVQVQSADRFGHKGGAVVAAVGWVEGTHKNFAGAPESTGNGVYTSPTGAAGTFHRAGFGLPGPVVMGRTALGAANGPRQNHGYVYALVEDAKVVSVNRTEGIALLPTEIPVPGTGISLGFLPDSALKGVYVSPDFGEHWVLMADRNEFNNVANGSTLAVLDELFGIGVGYQAWYDEWIAPDPTSQVGGVPTNLFFGLEEVWQTATRGVPQTGPTPFYAIAPYSNLGAEYLGCVGLQEAGARCRALVKTRPPSIHPDDHAGIVLPSPAGQRPQLLVGTDGGAYRADIPVAGLIPHGAFGSGKHAGLNTLLAFGVAPSADGTVYAGLQDNGTVRLDPAGGMRPIEIYGGDGTLVLTDPHDSQQALFAPPASPLTVTHDRGATKIDVEPTGGVRAKVWLTPFVLDELDSRRVLYGARDIYAADGGLAKLTPKAWHKVFDLGTVHHPGSTSAVGSTADPQNTATSIAARGGVAYVGFCAERCASFGDSRFSGGIATNVGGHWHIAAGRGLPQRLINAVAIDPADPRSVYVALGASTVSRWVAPGAKGSDGVDAAGGHLYRSSDGGESFTDISGALPKIGATALLVHGHQLVVGTPVGVFVSSSTAGTDWAALGAGLPAVNVSQLTPDPADPNQIYAATYGRGIWRYRFSS